MTRHRIIQGKRRHLAALHHDRVDPRDLHLSALGTLPLSASTRNIYAPPVRDQGELGSCTANAGCEAAGFLYHAETKSPDPMFSRLDLYASTRELEGTPLTEDSGAQVRDVFKAMRKFGVCLETTWAYDVAQFSAVPSRAAVSEALTHRAVSYLRCATLAAIKTSIAQGFPVIGGFVCYESLESEQTAQTGDVPYPAPNEQEIGGHCIYFDGYDDSVSDGAGGLGMLTFQNSWGTSWGMSGYGRLPYRYVADKLATDFWTLRKLTT